MLDKVDTYPFLVEGHGDRKNPVQTAATGRRVGQLERESFKNHDSKCDTVPIFPRGQVFDVLLDLLLSVAPFLERLVLQVLNHLLGQTDPLETYVRLLLHIFIYE